MIIARSILYQTLKHWPTYQWPSKEGEKLGVIFDSSGCCFAITTTTIVVSAIWKRDYYSSPPSSISWLEVPATSKASLRDESSRQLVGPRCFYGTSFTEETTARNSSKKSKEDHLTCHVIYSANSKRKSATMQTVQKMPQKALQPNPLS